MGTGRSQHLVTHHHLNKARRITKIKKSDSTMITTASYPASQGHRDSSMLGTKSAGAVGAYHEDRS
jgi:hypothetical protein